MAEFTYVTLAGDKQVTGSVNAETREAAIASLRQQNIKPLRVQAIKAKRGQLSIGKPKVKLRDLVIFTRELSTMVSAGVPLPRALSTLSGQAQNPYFKEAITGITRDVESGTPLADTFAKYPKIFSEVYVNMVAAGESGWDQANDLWIQNKLKARLLTDGEVKNINYIIDVTDSVVYLLGIAQSSTELDRVIAHARDVSGVKRVISHVRLKTDPRRNGG